MSFLVPSQSSKILDAINLQFCDYLDKFDGLSQIFAHLCKEQTLKSWDRQLSQKSLTIYLATQITQKLFYEKHENYISKLESQVERLLVKSLNSDNFYFQQLSLNSNSEESKLNH